MSALTTEIGSSRPILDELTFQPLRNGIGGTVGIPLQGNIGVFCYFLLDVRLPSDRLRSANPAPQRNEYEDEMQGEDHFDLFVVVALERSVFRNADQPVEIINLIGLLNR